MNRRITCALILLCALTAFAATPTQLVFTWQANPLNTVNGVNMWPACGATLKLCIASETIQDVTATPFAVATGISPTALTYSITPLPSAGSHSYCLEYIAYDQSGNLTTSSCDQVTVSVPSMVANHPVDLHAVPAAPSTAKPSVLSKVKKALHI